MQACRHRKPKRKSYGRIYLATGLVCRAWTSRPRTLQSSQHHGFHGGLQDTAVFAIRLCGARLDDMMNFLPARFTWLLLSVLCLAVPRTSARKAFQIGWQQHAILPGPNSGWSEAATAGAIERRLLGPIWSKGVLVTDVWLGAPADPPAGDDSDVRRAAVVVGVTGLFAAFLAVVVSLFRV